MRKNESPVRVTFEVVINHETVAAVDFKDAENKLKSALSSQYEAYICRREYDKDGKEIGAYLTI